MGVRVSVLVVLMGTALASVGLTPVDAGASPAPTPTVAKAVKHPRPVVTKVKPATGPATGGTTVTIKGRHLRGTTEVQFGTRPATDLVVHNDHRLTVVSPPNAAGKVYVRVVTDTGRSRRPVRARFTYEAPVSTVKAPTIGSVAPGKGPVAGGTTVTINGTGFAKATAATFDGVAGSSLSVVSDTQLTVVTPPGTDGPADVRVTNPGGTATAAGAFTYSTPAAAALFPSGLSVYFPDTGTFTPVPGATVPANVQAYDLDAAGRVYYDLGSNGGLSQFDATTGLTRSIYASDVSALRVAADGLVYYAIPTGAADVTGTYVFNPRTGTSTRYTTEIATSIVAVANGLAYGQYPSGFYLYDPSAAALTLVSATAPGQYDAAGDGSVVFATIGGALTRFQRNASGSFDATPVTYTDPPLSNPNVIAFSVSESGYVYVDLSVNGTWLYNPHTGTATRIDTRNPVFVVADRAGNGYADYAGNGGTVRYDLGAGAFTTLSANPNAFFGNDDVDTAGALYMDYNADGLYRFDPATSPVNQPFAGNQISTLDPTSTVGNR